MSLDNYTWKDRQRARREARAWRWFEVLVAFIALAAIEHLVSHLRPTVETDSTAQLRREVRHCLWEQRATAFVNRLRDEVTCVEDGR
jgi:hypothetical protein